MSLPPAETPNPAGPARRHFWKACIKAARMVAAAVVVFFVGWALLDRLRQVDWPSLQVRWTLLLASLAVQCVSLVVWAWSFHMLLAHLGRPPRPTTTFAAAWLSRLGKYVPGKVASVVGAVWLLGSRGVAPAAVLGASVLQQGLWIVLGLVASLPLTLWEPVHRVFPLAWLGCVVVGGGGLVCLHPRVFLTLANWSLRRVGIVPLAMTRGARLYAGPAATVVAGIILAGISLWLMILAFYPIEADMLPLCIAASTFSAVAGYLVLFAPGGLGVREGIMLVILTPVIGPAPAAVMTVVSRLMQTGAEALFGGVGAIILWRRPPVPSAASEPEIAAAAAPVIGPDGLAITVIVVTAPRGRARGSFHLPPQTDTRLELIEAGRLMNDLGLIGAFDASPGLSANYAAAIASGDVLALVSADAEPAADWVASVRRFFAEHPEARAVTGGSVPAGGPTVQLAVRADAYRSADGCNLMRPPEADVLTELARRLDSRGVAIERDERLVVRPAPGLRWRSAVVRTFGCIATLVRGGKYGRFESPILASASPMLVGPGDGRPPAASVVVPIKSSHRCALLALHALSRQDMTEPYEIIACLPQGAPLAAEIARMIPQIRLNLCGSDAGPGAGRNAGIAVARGEVIAFTDADCLAERTWLRSIVAAVRSRGGGPVRGWWQVHHAWSAVGRAMQLAEEGTARPLRGRLVPGISGATMAISRRLLEVSGAVLPRGFMGPRRWRCWRACRRMPARCGSTRPSRCANCGTRRLRGPGGGCGILASARGGFAGLGLCAGRSWPDTGGWCRLWSRPGCC